MKRHYLPITAMALIILMYIPYGAEAYTIPQDYILHINEWSYSGVQNVKNTTVTFQALPIEHTKDIIIESEEGIIQKKETEDYTLSSGMGYVSKDGVMVVDANDTYWESDTVGSHKNCLTLKSNGSDSSHVGYISIKTHSTDTLSFYMYIYDIDYGRIALAFNDSSTAAILIEKYEEKYVMYDGNTSAVLSYFDSNVWYRISLRFKERVVIHVYGIVDGQNVPITDPYDIGYPLDSAHTHVTDVTIGLVKYGIEDRIASIDGFITASDKDFDAPNFAYLPIPRYLGDHYDEITINFAVNMSEVYTQYMESNGSMIRRKHFSICLTDFYREELHYFYVESNASNSSERVYINGIYVGISDRVQMEIIINENDIYAKVGEASVLSIYVSDLQNSDLLLGVEFEGALPFTIYNFSVKTNGFMPTPKYELSYQRISRFNYAILNTSCENIGSESAMYMSNGKLIGHIHNGTHVHHISVHIYYDVEITFIIRICNIDNTVYEDVPITIRFNIDYTHVQKNDQVYEFIKSYWVLVVGSVGTLGVVSTKKRKSKTIDVQEIPYVEPHRRVIIGGNHRKNYELFFDDD